MTFIPPDTYKTIIESLPILCVDVMITNENGEYLLVRRANEPLKGEWWVPGGRVLKSEPLENAVKRKIKEELGIDVKVVGPVGYYEDQYDKNPHETISPLHTVGIVFHARLLTTNVTLDGQSSEWRFFNQLPARFAVKPFAHPFQP